MKDYGKPQSCPDVPLSERKAMELTKLIQMRRWMGIHAEATHVQIAFDEFCRRDSADAEFARRIEHHSLIDDNPTSG